MAHPERRQNYSGSKESVRLRIARAYKTIAIEVPEELQHTAYSVLYFKLCFNYGGGFSVPKFSQLSQKLW